MRIIITIGYYKKSLSSMKLREISKLLNGRTINRDGLWTAEPFNSLAILPLSVSLSHILHVNIYSESAHFTVFELANI
jgi:hypothetical protein